MPTTPANSECRPGKIAILLNPRANHGRAAHKWKTVENQVRKQLEDKASSIDVWEVTDPGHTVDTLVDAGYQMLIAAGGDGSVHYLLQEMMKYPDKELLLGAIGLGSSNDFHKPFRHTIHGVPLRILPELAKMQDVGCIQYVEESGLRKTRYFLINASMGVTANANWLFNHPDVILKHLKGRWVNLAILYAVVKTILQHRNRRLRLETEDFCTFGRFANLALLKSVHVSGGFFYDQTIHCDDGQLGLNVCEDISRKALLRVLYDLSRGVFSGKPGRLSAFIHQLQVDTMGNWLPLEMDGEVVMASDIHCNIIPQALSVVQIQP